jgi:hypothetical protein
MVFLSKRNAPIRENGMKEKKNVRKFVHIFYSFSISPCKWRNG